MLCFCGTQLAVGEVTANRLLTAIQPFANSIPMAIGTNLAVLPVAPYHGDIEPQTTRNKKRTSRVSGGSFYF